MKLLAYQQNTENEQVSAVIKQQLSDMEVRITSQPDQQSLQKEKKTSEKTSTGKYKRPDYLLRLL
jgi:hypothetical protein